MSGPATTRINHGDTLIRSAGLICTLRATPRIPVVTSSRLLVGQAPRSLGGGHRVNGFGRIFAPAGRCGGWLE